MKTNETLEGHERSWQPIVQTILSTAHTDAIQPTMEYDSEEEEGEDVYDGAHCCLYSHFSLSAWLELVFSPSLLGAKKPARRMQIAVQNQARSNAHCIGFGLVSRAVTITRTSTKRVNAMLAMRGVLVVCGAQSRASSLRWNFGGFCQCSANIAQHWRHLCAELAPTPNNHASCRTIKCTTSSSSSSGQIFIVPN